MNRTLTALLALALVALFATAASARTATPRIDRREWNQRARIREGIVSGSLTAREAHRLRMGERRIQRMEWRAKSDGYVSARERARVSWALDRESARIWRLKHNGRGVR